MAKRKAVSRGTKTNKVKTQTRVVNTEPKGADIAISLVVIIVLLGFGWYFVNADKKAQQQASVNQEVVTALETSSSDFQTEKLAGDYTARVPGAGGERIVSLNLGSDGTAQFVENYDTKDALVSDGEWTIATAEAKVQLSLDSGRGLTFRYSPQKQSLTLVDYDLDEWGTAGLTLTKAADLLAYTWTWQKTTLKGGNVLAAESDKLGLEFGQEGTLLVRTDCNGGRGSYTLAGETLSFSPLITTEMFCEGAQESVFLSQLATTVGFNLEADTLTLILADDAQMHFIGSKIVEI